MLEGFTAYKYAARPARSGAGLKYSHVPWYDMVRLEHVAHRALLMPSPTDLEQQRNGGEAPSRFYLMEDVYHFSK